MTLNRFDRIQYIDKGKQVNIGILFYKYMNDIIPIYCSTDIEKYSILSLNGCILTVFNKDYLESLDDTYKNILIIDKIIECSKVITDRLVLDLHLANWFGYNSTMNYIENSKSKHCSDRIRKLETFFGKPINDSICTLENMLSDIDFVKLNEVENMSHEEIS